MKALPKWKLAVLILLILAFAAFVLWSLIEDMPEKDYGLEFTLSPDNSHYIVSGIGSCRDTEIVVPSTYNYKPVKRIGNYALSRFTSLTEITIPNSVTSIDSFAFAACTGLTDITIPNSVTAIGDKAFYGCKALKEITFAGTKAQWNKIEKGNAWNDTTGSYTVRCTDGDISKAA